MLWCGSAMKSFAFSFGFCHFVVGQTKNQHHTQFFPLKSTVSISINIVIHHTPPQCIKHCKLTKCGTSNHFRLLVVLFCFNCGCKSCFVAWKTYRSKTCNYMLNSTCNYVFMEFVHEMNSPENLFCLPQSHKTRNSLNLNGRFSPFIRGNFPQKMVFARITFSSNVFINA